MFFRRINEPPAHSIGVAHIVAKTLLRLKRMAVRSEHPSDQSVCGAVALRRRWGLSSAIAVDAGASEGVTDRSTASVDGLFTEAMTMVQGFVARRAVYKRFESLLRRAVAHWRDPLENQ